MTVCVCVCGSPHKRQHQNSLDVKTKHPGSPKSFRKTSQVMTSIAFSYLSLGCVCACVCVSMESPDNISDLLSGCFFSFFYCKRLQIHLPDNKLIQDPQPFGLRFTQTALVARPRKKQQKKTNK